MVQYQLSPNYTSTWSGGSIQYEQGRTFDIGAALTAGGGTFTVDETLHPTLVTALDSYEALMRSTNPSPPPPAFIDFTDPCPVFICAQQPDPRRDRPALWIPLDPSGNLLSINQWQVLI